MKHALTSMGLVMASSWLLCADPLLVFEQDLRFGVDERQPEYEWIDGQVACDFAVHPSGHIFVSDQRNASILEFDGDGSFIRQVAQRGQGPGEYQGIGAFVILEDGRAIGLDTLQGTLKAHHYNKHVQFESSSVIRNTVGFLFKADFSQQLGFIQMIRFGADQNLSFRLDLVDHELQVIKEIRAVPWPIQDPSRLNDPNHWAEYMAGQFKGFWQAADRAAGFLEDGRLVIAHGKDASYEIWSSDAKEKLKTIRSPRKPYPFTSQQREELVEAVTTILFKQTGNAFTQIVTPNVLQRAIDQADLPKTQSPVYDLIAIDATRFCAVTRANFATGRIELEVIDTEKGYLGRVAFPDPGVFSIFGTRLQFRAGFAYAMVWNQDGENQMVRYRYRFP